MAVVIDSYAIPEKGEFEFFVKRTIHLRITADEARRTVQHWLLDQVSYMMGAESPQLVLQEDATVWQVPVSSDLNGQPDRACGACWSSRR